MHRSGRRLTYSNVSWRSSSTTSVLPSRTSGWRVTSLITTLVMAPRYARTRLAISLWATRAVVSCPSDA
jgi:hypothetical protein